MTNTTPQLSKKQALTGAADRLDNALDSLCSLLAWVEPQPSALLDEWQAAEHIDTSGMSKTAATMYEAAGTIELLMLRMIRCKELKPLMD